MVSNRIKNLNELNSLFLRMIFFSESLSTFVEHELRLNELILIRYDTSVINLIWQKLRLEK